MHGEGAQLRAALAAGTLPGAFAAGAAGHPSATLTVGADSAGLAELLSAARRWATVLAEHGVGPGARVVLRAGSSMQMVTAYLALLSIGAPVILVSPASAPDETARAISHAAASAMVSDDAADDLAIPVLPLSQLAAAAADVMPHPGVSLRPDDLALIAFTSGTTGRPRGVPLTHAMLLSSMRALLLAWRWTSEDRLVHALPLYHQHGLGAIHATFLAGSSAHLLPHFDPKALAAAAAQTRATVMWAVPTMYQRLLEVAPDVRSQLSGLRLAASGSAPLSATAFTRIRRELGLEPLERYGLTESGLDVSNLYDGPRLAGSVGYPLPGVEVEIADAEGTFLPAGADGEILLRGPQVFDGYLDDPAATTQAFADGGWFRTGDLGRLDDHGALWITGRIKDLVITGGMNVSPAEVEKVLVAFPGVLEAAVSGVPDDRWGEQVVAWLVADTPIDRAALDQHCRRELAAFKCPKRLFFVDELPRTGMGKIQRARLVPGSA